MEKLENSDIITCVRVLQVCKDQNTLQHDHRLDKVLDLILVLAPHAQKADAAREVEREAQRAADAKALVQTHLALAAARCLRFPTEIYTRGCHWSLKLACVRPMSFLSGVRSSYRLAL